jgi:hypothetical protein
VSRLGVMDTGVAIFPAHDASEAAVAELYGE